MLAWGLSFWIPPCQQTCYYTIIITLLFPLFLQIGFYFWLKIELCKVQLVDCVLSAYLLWKLKGAWEMRCNSKRRGQTKPSLLWRSDVIQVKLLKLNFHRNLQLCSLSSRCLAEGAGNWCVEVLSSCSSYLGHWWLCFDYTKCYIMLMYWNHISSWAPKFSRYFLCCSVSGL